MAVHKDRLWRVYRNLSGGGLSIAQLQERTGYTDASIRNYLRALEESDLIMQEQVNKRKKIWKMKDGNTS